MSLYNKIRQDAKLDSRRFGKSIVCRIVTGSLLSFIKSRNLIPPGVFINSDTGLDPVNNNMLVIPVSKFNEIEKSFLQYLTDVAQPEKSALDDLVDMTNVSRGFIDLLKQNMILVTLNAASLRDGKLAGSSPSCFDVIIDSVDVNQAIEATYVFKNRDDLRPGPGDLKWNS